MTRTVVREGQIEQLVLELVSLSKRKPLRGGDKKRAHELMVTLRQSGWTNDDIQRITGGAWSEPTIKLATRGTKVVDEASKQGVVSVVGEFIQSGRTFDDLDRFVSFNKHLESAGLSYDDLLSFITEAQKQGLGHADISRILKDLKVSNIRPDMLSEIHVLVAEMRSLGIDNELLVSIIEATKAFGDPKQVIRAVRNHGNLGAIESEVRQLGARKQELVKDVNVLSEKLEDKRGEVQALDKELAVRSLIRKQVDEVQRLGFDPQDLRDIQQLSKNYGGPRGLFTAFKEFDDLRGIRAEKDKEKTELDKAKAEHVHLLPVMAMCDRLIFEFHFSPESLDGILKIAEKFGGPFQVSDALMSFKDLCDIKSQVSEARSEKSALEARIAELKLEVRTLAARRDQAYESAAKAITFIEDRCSKALVNLTSRFRDDAKEFGELKAEAGKLEEELRLARILQTLTKYPSECKKIPIPLDYDILMLEGVMNHCRVMGVNPMVKAGDTIQSKYYSIYSSKEVELIDLLGWAIRGLQIASSPPERAS